MSDDKPILDPRTSHLDSAWEEPTYTDERPYGASAGNGGAPMPPSVPPLAPEPITEEMKNPIPAPVPLPVPLGNVLTQRTSLGGLSVPSWMLPAGAALIAAVLGTLLTAAVLLLVLPATPAPSPASSSPAGPWMHAADAPALDPAAAGDVEAMKRIEDKSPAERTVDETIALATGRAVQKRAALGALADELRQNPELADDPDVSKRLREAAQDQDTTRDALRIIASLPAPRSLDLLYELWVGTRERTPTTMLAEALVYTKELRGKASPALAVALDLREATTCEQVQPILPRAVEHGDRRSIRLLGKLMIRHGCGPNKASDCYECLRSEDGGVDLVQDALKAARGRVEPKL